jgi:uncharacterized flavoprotein (TIGR03862 family)
MQRVAIIGGGPAGLMAAERLAAVDGLEITLFDAMPSLGRKFLMAGKGGMNITHAEPLADFVRRYGTRQEEIARLLNDFSPTDLRAWIDALGITTFVGTSGRVFPTEMKAAPLLRAWLQRLRKAGVHFKVRHRWQGWRDNQLLFATPDGETLQQPDAVILALGGASWARLGSDGAWFPWLAQRGVPLAPLRPANCGFDVAWTAHFSERFAGAPVKSVIACHGQHRQQGEFNITATGIEGGLIYALSAALRDQLEAAGQATLFLDLAPGRSLERLQSELSRPRGRDSLANHWRRCVGIEGVKAALLRELLPAETLTATDQLATAIKALPVPLRATRPIDEAISTAGGVRFEGLNADLMLSRLPGVFCAGEMLDWEAPTGGYLLTACLASGHRAGLGVKAWLASRAIKAA